MISTLTPELKETIVTMYQQGHGATTVARAINRSECFVKYNLKKLGYSIRKAGDYRKYTIISDYFNKIDTHEKAYWLGFFYADAYNYEKKAGVKVCLNIKDTEHLNQLKLALGSNQPLSVTAGNKRDNTIQIIFNNKFISKDLATHGCTQCKSFTITFPKLNKEFEPSFMLGFFDGDGCVTGSRKRGSFSICTNYVFAMEYQQKLMEACNLDKTKLYTKKKTMHKPVMEKAYHMRYSALGDMKSIYNFLYSTNIYSLPRKKQKFQELIGMDNTKDNLI